MMSFGDPRFINGHITVLTNTAVPFCNFRENILTLRPEIVRESTNRIISKAEREVSLLSFLDPSTRRCRDTVLQDKQKESKKWSSEWIHSYKGKIVVKGGIAEQETSRLRLEK